MSSKHAHRRHRVIVAAVVSTFSVGTFSSKVWADSAQNIAANAGDAALTAAGFGGYNGNGITIGQNETGMPNYSGNAIGSAMLPNGNPNLPGNVSWLAGGGTNIRNHATEVAGVIASTIPGQNGIAIGANILSANTADITIGTAGSWGSLNLQTQLQRSSIINMSWGGTAGGTNYTNNGNNYISPFVDWGAQQYNNLVVVAGNERRAESPSDAYNILNVGALGIRTGANMATHSYDTLATYNTPNATSDGRIGVDLVAPGGDPGAGTWTANVGAFNALPAFTNQFITTAGGQYHFSGTTAGGTPVYGQDTFNGNSSTAAYGSAYDNKMPYVAGPPFPRLNPGTNLGGTDAVVSGTLAGTSFSAPLVSGAAAVVTQYGTAFQNNTNFANVPSDALDHRVLRAIMMNGASNTNPDGTPLTSSTNGTTYTRAPVYLSGGMAVNKQLPAYFKNFSSNAQSGLDPSLGAGELNLVNSLKNYAAGEQGIGVVNPTGWDYATAPTGRGAPTVFNYDFTIGGQSGEFDATLCWDSNVTITANGGANYKGSATWQPGSTSTASTTLTRSTLTDLDLYLCSTTSLGGSVSGVIAYSNSVLDNDEHIYYPAGLPAGTYELDVVDPADAAAETPFGVAWATLPEPTSFGLIVFGSLVILRRRRHPKET